MGSIFVMIQSYLFGSLLESYLFSSIFRNKIDTNKPRVLSQQSDDKSTMIEGKTKSKISFSRQRTSIRKQKALQRIEKELDIVNFVRKQLKISVALETIFSRAERVSFNNNRRFNLDTSGSDSEEKQSKVHI